MDKIYLREGEKMISKAEEYDMNFGTNIISNCSGAVAYKKKGKEKLLFVLQKNGEDILLTTEVRNDRGQLLTKIVKNDFKWTTPGFRPKRLFDLDKTVAKELILRRIKDDKIIFDAQIIDNRNINIIGTFFIGTFKIEVTNEKLMIGSIELKNNKIIGFGYGLLIEENAFSLGVAKSWKSDNINRYVESL